jgi:hypothetical protein
MGVLNHEDCCYVFFDTDIEKRKYLHLVVARYLLHSFSGIKVWWKSSTRKFMVGLELQSNITQMQCPKKIVTRFQFMVGSPIQHCTKIVL